MALEYLIYADESEKKGTRYSNFYGGVLVRSTDLRGVVDRLEARKAELGLGAEVKWIKVTSQYLDRYLALLTTFMDMVVEDRVKVRIMFTDNSFVPRGLTPYHYDWQYHLLYYQFIKHAFGLQFSNEGDLPEVRVRVYLDELPATRDRNVAFKGHLASLSRQAQFRRAGIVIDPEQIAEVHSHEHVLMQCLDVVLGSMQAKLNNKFAAQPGQRRRGNRTIAKEKLYRHINRAIREIYPGFNIGITTGMQGDGANRWRHSYRHWVFVPKGAERVLSKIERKN